jgi:hypothetical protein
VCTLGWVAVAEPLSVHGWLTGGVRVPACGLGFTVWGSGVWGEWGLGVSDRVYGGLGAPRLGRSGVDDWDYVVGPVAYMACQLGKRAETDGTTWLHLGAT